MYFQENLDKLYLIGLTFGFSSSLSRFFLTWSNFLHWQESTLPIVAINDNGIIAKLSFRFFLVFSYFILEFSYFAFRKCFQITSNDLLISSLQSHLRGKGCFSHPQRWKRWKSSLVGKPIQESLTSFELNGSQRVRLRWFGWFGAARNCPRA